MALVVVSSCLVLVSLLNALLKHESHLAVSTIDFSAIS